MEFDIKIFKELHGLCSSLRYEDKAWAKACDERGLTGAFISDLKAGKTARKLTDRKVEALINGLLVLGVGRGIVVDVVVKLAFEQEDIVTSINLLLMIAKDEDLLATRAHIRSLIGAWSGWSGDEE